MAFFVAILITTSTAAFLLMFASVSIVLFMLFFTFVACHNTRNVNKIIFIIRRLIVLQKEISFLHSQNQFAEAMNWHEPDSA